MVGDKRLNVNSRTRTFNFRRCKKVRPTDIESLPDELLLEILVRLPADYLYDRARLVCRRWYHVIHSNAFVNTQLHHSTYGLLLSTYSGYNPCPLFFVTATQGRIEISEFSFKCRSRLLASCNGLAVESQFLGKYFPHIINPATKQTFFLPSLSSYFVHSTQCGIAYVAASMEYKVTMPHIPHWPASEPSLAILTIGVDNSWRNVRVEHLPGQHRVFLSGFPLITEGFMHWTSRGSTSVLTLDMETEIVTVSRVPLSQAYFCRRQMYYLPTGRCLSLLVANKGKDILWEFWAMKPETGEWMKLRADIKLGTQNCRLQQFACRHDEVLEPLGWVKYPEILALRFSGEGCSCIFFNLDTHEISSTDLPSSFAGFSAILHKNNLVWLS